MYKVNPKQLIEDAIKNIPIEKPGLIICHPDDLAMIKKLSGMK